MQLCTVVYLSAGQGGIAQALQGFFEEEMGVKRRRALSAVLSF